MSIPAHNDDGSDADRRRQLTVLNQLTILSPCEVAWDGMTGTERERHCDSCVKSVHNLIEHTTDEAYRLVTEPDAHVCVRIHRDAAGNVLTKDSPIRYEVAPDPDLGRRGVLRRLALLAASWLGLTAAKGCSRPTSGEPRPATGGEAVFMGDVGPPDEHELVVGRLCAPPKPTGSRNAGPGYDPALVQGGLGPPSPLATGTTTKPKPTSSATPPSTTGK